VVLQELLTLDRWAALIKNNMLKHVFLPAVQLNSNLAASTVQRSRRCCTLMLQVQGLWQV
jgi:hypothetical protein